MSSTPTPSPDVAIPAGYASPRALAIRLVALLLVCTVVSVSCHYATRPGPKPPILHRLIISAPLLGAIITSSGLIAGVLLAPFTAESCPCHWPLDFAGQYTTSSVLLSYSPAKYALWAGIGIGAVLLMLVAFQGYHRWYAGSTDRRCLAVAWLAFVGLSSVSGAAVLAFPRHFDRPTHLFVSFIYFLSLLICVAVGHALVQSETVESGKWKSRSAAAAAVVAVLSVWYGAAYFLHAAKSEGVLAISEHALMLAEFSWFGVLGAAWIEEHNLFVENLVPLKNIYVTMVQV